MQSVLIGANQAGQRLDKFLHKYLPAAPGSFLYKMLRKKNITLNGGRAEGRELLSRGDEVKLYLSGDTILKFGGRLPKKEADGGEAFSGKPEAVGRKIRLQEAPDSCGGEIISRIGSPDSSRIPGASNSPVPDRLRIGPGLGRNTETAAYFQALHSLRGIQVLYEDGNVLLLNKPAGVLTQKASPSDLSLNEWMIGYLLEKGAIGAEELHTFRPSVCNRLDRNTSGLVLCGKSLAGSQALSRIIRDRSVRKFYRTVIAGRLDNPRRLEGYLVKDERSNTVSVNRARQGGGGRAAMGNQFGTRSVSNYSSVHTPGKAGGIRGKQLETRSVSNDSSAHTPGKNSGLQRDKNEKPVLTLLRPLGAVEGLTYAEAELVTGKTHQIRAQLAANGCPLIGDYKYGDRKRNEEFRRRFGLKAQLLHAYRLEFPELEGPLSGLSRRIVIAPLPELFQKILLEEQLPELL